MAAPAEADYVIVGGGLTGCVVASSLKQRNPALDILVIEAGIDPSNGQRISSFPGLFSLLGSELDWSYHSAPQPATANRVHVTSAGKALGGGTTTSFGGWNRGDASDYDQWEELSTTGNGATTAYFLSFADQRPSHLQM